MLDRYKGCLIGSATGDALGAPFEFWRREKVQEYLNENELKLIQFQRGDCTYPQGFYTDDTSMMICLAESLIEKDFDLDHQFDLYRKWLLEGHATPEGKNSYGVGQQTWKALSKNKGFKKGVDGLSEKASGNGALMRIAPIALMYHNDFEAIKEKSLHSSFLTHNNEIAGWVCVVFNSLISFTILGKEKLESIEAVLKMYENEMPAEITELLKHPYQEWEDFTHPISGYSVDTLRIALWSWLTSKSYEESIRKVLLLGNDTDTFAAVTGALSGSYFGYNNIPNQWKAELMREEHIGGLASKLLNINS